MESVISSAPNQHRHSTLPLSGRRLDVAGVLLAVAVLVVLAVAGSGSLASVAGDRVVAAGGDPLAAPSFTPDAAIRVMPLSTPTAYRAGEGRPRFGHLLAPTESSLAALGNGAAGALAALAALILLRLLSHRAQPVRAPPGPPDWTSGALLRRGSPLLA